MDLAVNLCVYRFKVFSENMGHLESIKMVIIRKCTKLLSIYDICLMISWLASMLLPVAAKKLAKLLLAFQVKNAYPACFIVTNC